MVLPIAQEMPSLEAMASLIVIYMGEKNMPHVVIEGPASIEQFYEQFETIYQRDNDTILKVKEMFISTQKSKAILECIVVEDRFSHIFYMLTSGTKGRITVRLDPLTDPEKSESVKRLLALVSYTFKSQHPDCRYGTHNLEGYLIE